MGKKTTRICELDFAVSFQEKKISKKLQFRL